MDRTLGQQEQNLEPLFAHVGPWTLRERSVSLQFVSYLLVRTSMPPAVGWTLFEPAIHVTAARPSHPLNSGEFYTLVHDGEQHSGGRCGRPQLRFLRTGRSLHRISLCRSSKRVQTHRQETQTCGR